MGMEGGWGHAHSISLKGGVVRKKEEDTLDSKDGGFELLKGSYVQTGRILGLGTCPKKKTSGEGRSLSVREVHCQRARERKRKAETDRVNFLLCRGESENQQRERRVNPHRVRPSQRSISR